MTGDPVSGVPSADRYRGNGANDMPDRYAETRGRGDAGSFCSLPTTIEEEVANGGWTRTNRPTGPNPRRLYTTGMRGESDIDDDPVPDGMGGYKDG